MLGLNEWRKTVLFNKIVISLIILTKVLLSSSMVFAQAQYDGISITDFTIHKVIPQKSPVSQHSAVKPEPVKKQIAKTVAKPEVKKPSVPVKTVKKEIKQQSEPKSQPKAKLVSVKKQVAKTVKIIEKPVVREIPETKLVPKKLEASADKEDTGFNKDAYTKSLNNYLKDDNLASDSMKIVEESKLNSFDYIVRPSMSLGIVLFLILAFAWLYGKVKGISPNAGLLGKFGDADMNKFKVLATSTLGQGKIIHLVEINGKQLVVGSTNNNINLLTEISPDEMQNLRVKAGLEPDLQPKELDPEEYDPEIYSAKYSELYREYIEKKNKKD